MKARILARFLEFALLVLFLFGSASDAAEPSFDFGLVGRITIVVASSFIDGDSVSVHLVDEQKNISRVFYRNTWGYDRDAHGGQFEYTKDGKVTYFRRFGSYERSLLQLLQTACVETYGTSNPDDLKAADGWDRFAMGSLFGQASHRDDTKSPKAKRPTGSGSAQRRGPG